MKNMQSLLIGLLLIQVSCKQQITSSFDQYFTHANMRIDYFHTGDSKSEVFKIDQIYKYKLWAGSLTKLIDELNYGIYYYKIYDQVSEKLIYSKGFDSYFVEYQVTKPAIEGQVKQFHESVLIPFPKTTIIFALEKRSPSGIMEEIFRTEINPDIAQEKPIDPEVRTYTSLNNGDPNKKIDIAIIGEGYTEEEDQKFQNDLKRFTEAFFNSEPCKSNKNKFNIRGVLKPSEDSGIDEPRLGIDKNTPLNVSFNTMGLERYLLTEDNQSLHDIAGHVPYDAVCIMVNHSRYGGGGIYNFYSVYTSDNIESYYVMVHEFGHSFFGLADEYYASSTPYDSTKGYEPSQPNITAMKDPNNIKWGHLLSDNIGIPTPWPKAKYDSLKIQLGKQGAEMNAAIARLQKNGASKDEVAKLKTNYNIKIAQMSAEVDQCLESPKFADKVGVFEGAGYASKGLYRPSINCMMFTQTDYFCPVCQEAMLKVIRSY